MARTRRDLPAVLAFTLALLLAGCGEQEPQIRKAPDNPPPMEFSGPPGSMPGPPPLVKDPDQPDDQAAASADTEDVQPRRVIGETTTDIRDLQNERNSGERVEVSDGKITATSPITISGNAYTSIVGRAAVLKIRHALDLYNALNGRYPESTEEFMAEIIEANNIALPQLPAYQEYAYDAENKRLVVLEYPDRKEQLRQRNR